MSTLTPKEALQALLAGKKLNSLNDGAVYILHNGYIYDVQEDGYYYLNNREINLARLELIPSTISVNGIDVPEPLRETPKYKDNIYIANLDDVSGCIVSEWTNSVWQQRALERGIVHSTKEAAIAHADAILSASIIKEASSGSKSAVDI
jgi:hypothetical protein